MKKTKKYCIYQLDIRGIPFKYHIYSNLNDLKVDLYKLINTQKNYITSELDKKVK